MLLATGAVRLSVEWLRSRVMARLNLGIPRPALCSDAGMRRRAERVQAVRRGRRRQLRVLVNTICSPNDCALSSERGWNGHHLNRQPGAVGGMNGHGMWFSAIAVLEVAMAFSRRRGGDDRTSQLHGFSVPAGDEAVIADRQERRGAVLGTGRRLHPPDDAAPSERRSSLTLEPGL